MQNVRNCTFTIGGNVFMSGGLAVAFLTETEANPPYFPVFSSNSQDPAPGILPEIIFPLKLKYLEKSKIKTFQTRNSAGNGAHSSFFQLRPCTGSPRTAAITQPQRSDPLRPFLYLQPVYDMILNSAVIESDPFFPFDIHGRRLIM